MSHLLDTDSCIGYLRQRPALLVQRINARPASELRVCSVVKAELYFGAALSRQPQLNRAKVDTFVQQFLSLPFDDTAAEGTLIGANDLLIAAIALANHCTLVTHNTHEFGRVAGLAIEDWQVP
jgi:tRNA(fMet)-specific endonuclease VapC